jgi:glycerol-3-phosphate dehydrogenase (NAD(P)+)
MKASVGVLGSGSWGTALAIHLARTGHPVALWGRNAEMAARLRAAGEHSTCHPGVRFPEGLFPTAELEAACTASDAIVVSCPSHAVRTLGELIRPMLGRDTLIVSTSKGIEQDTHLTMSGILEAVLPEHATRVSVLSGPSFAREVARGLPTAVTAAAGQLSVAERLQRLFNGPTFRVYTSTDLVGVEIGGAVKNVIALAAGVSDGLGFGHNTRAALITRGLAEISRLAIHLGANPKTLYGLSCLGDLVLTCTGDLSRNRTVGLRLGKGERLEEIIASMNEVAEGVRNTASIRGLAHGAGVEMPITEQMYAMLYEGKDPSQAVVDLAARPLRHELD